jgi:hypothetical protein
MPIEPDLLQPDLTRQRQQAHALLDILPAEKLTAVRSLLEVMVEPLSRLLALAPLEDEEIAPALRSIVARAFHTKRSCASSVSGKRANRPLPSGSLSSGLPRPAPICAPSFQSTLAE